jgi:23S rRNA pseudouridine1911/1915/1917 synthase
MSETSTVYRVGLSDRGKRLDRFLKEKIPALSRSRLKRAVGSRISLSWTERPKPSTPVRPGGEVRVGYEPVHEERVDTPIAILARGEDWIAVDKPAGLVAHPVRSVRDNCLIRLLRRQEGDEQLRLAHRLDRETSGVLLVARSAEAARRLSRAFERGLVEKAYLALVRGVVRNDEGEISLPIGRAERSLVFVRRAVSPSGEAARTDFRVLERLPAATLIEVFPRTGRRHQIRVHLEAIGHPIAGDILYGRPDRDYLDLVRGIRDARLEDGSPRRHLLHSVRLRFEDPSTSEPVEVVSPPPADFLEAVAAEKAAFARPRGEESP